MENDPPPLEDDGPDGSGKDFSSDSEMSDSEPVLDLTDEARAHVASLALQEGSPHASNRRQASTRTATSRWSCWSWAATCRRVEATRIPLPLTPPDPPPPQGIPWEEMPDSREHFREQRLSTYRNYVRAPRLRLS